MKKGRNNLIVVSSRFLNSFDYQVRTDICSGIIDIISFKSPQILLFLSGRVVLLSLLLLICQTLHSSNYCSIPYEGIRERIYVFFTNAI